MKTTITILLLLTLSGCYRKITCPDGSKMKIKMEKVKGKPEKNLSY